jgi:hypothetical protein
VVVVRPEMRVAWEGDFGDFDALGTCITNLFG